VANEPFLKDVGSHSATHHQQEIFIQTTPSPIGVEREIFFADGEFFGLWDKK
jgi:hypothetical protein